MNDHIADAGKMADLARRAIACDGWRWMPGMRRLTFDAGHRYPSRVADDGTFLDGLFPIPDLTDPATIGCVMSLVREAWGEPGLSCIGWRTDEGASIFMMMGGDNYKMKSVIMGQTEHSTRAEALIVALEAAS